MSVENVDRFVALLKADARLRGALGAMRDPQAMVDRAVRMAAERDMSFTSAELESRLAPAPAGDRELDDGQLEAVTGGFGSLSLNLTLPNLLKQFGETEGGFITNLK